MEGDEDSVSQEYSDCKQWKVCLVGDMGVGKSSILTRIKDSTFCINSLTTTGAIFGTVNVNVDKQAHKFIVWDTPGQERFRFFAPVYYRGIRAALLVFSVVDKRSYQSVTNHWVPSVLNHNTSDGRKIILCLVGNKADMQEEREVTKEEAELYAAEIGAMYVETSAFTGDNVHQLFEELARRVDKVLEEEQKRKMTSQAADGTDSTTNSTANNSKTQATSNLANNITQQTTQNTTDDITQQTAHITADDTLL